MSTTTQETVITQDQDLPDSSQRSGQARVSQTTHSQASQSQTASQIVYFLLGVIEVLLGFRFVLKLMGASPASGFVSFTYSISNVLISPFEGIFRRAVTQGIETSAVIEPATIVAVIVYAIIGWGVVSLIRMLSREPQA